MLQIKSPYLTLGGPLSGIKKWPPASTQMGKNLSWYFDDKLWISQISAYAYLLKEIVR